MTFAEMLREYIGNRTLEDVIAACAEYGVQIDSPQLSRMRSGTRPAPTDEKVITVLAKVCGRDPEPLVLLAKYQRSPHEVMEIIIDAFVRADQCALWISDQGDAGKLELITRLKQGETVPPSLALSLLDGDYPGLETLRETYHHYRNRAMEIIELVSDTERAAWGKPGERGTLIPERIGPKKLLEAVREVARLAHVPEGAMWAAVASVILAKSPNAGLGEVLDMYRTFEAMSDPS